MLQLTRKTEYALIALSHLGRRRLAEEGPASARSIAEAYRLPLPLLMNILKELAQAGLLTSTRGATGGYVLAAEPAEVSLLQVVHAIEGPVKLTPCCHDEDTLPIVGQSCSVEENCPIQGPIRALHRRILGFVADVTLEELMTDLPEAEPEPQPVGAPA
ncbi:MAG: Rrf2 family transcriptional regulator [Planctomycetota bacterium]